MIKQIATVRPGEVLVIVLDEKLSVESIAAMRDSFKNSFPDNKVIIVWDWESLKSISERL